MREVTVIIPEDRVGDLYEVIAGYYREHRQRSGEGATDTTQAEATAAPATQAEERRDTEAATQVTEPAEAPTAREEPQAQAAPEPARTPRTARRATGTSEARTTGRGRAQRKEAPAAPVGGKYAKLIEHLNKPGQDRREFTFAQIERILGFPLPESAKNHRAWWANSENHTQARTWMAAGWRTEGLDLKGKKVSFVRADATPAGAAPAQAATKGKTTAATSSQGAKAATRSGKRSTTRKRTKTQAAGEDASAGERYAALANLLRAGEPQVEFSFEELEEAGVDLPRSAFSQEDWWANSESNEQALTWISQGYRATDVDLDQGRVRFKRY